MGSSNYIKKKFGIGYKLNLYAKENLEEIFIKNKEEIKGIVKKLIPSSTYNSQTVQSNLLFIIPFYSQTELPNLFEKLEEKQEFIKFGIDLEMNSLEDAFINIGLDEEKFLKKNENEDSKISYQEMIPVPDCLYYSPNYSFIEQFNAMFLRKYYSTIRSYQNAIMFALPLVFFIIGIVVSNQMSIEEEIENAVNLRLYIVSIFIVEAYSFGSSIYIGFTVFEREKNLKYALNVMGCKTLPYWMATFAFDFLIFWIIFIFFFIIAAITKSQFILDSAAGILLIVASFSVSLISFAYMCGFMYKKSNSAFKTFPVMNIFIFWLLPYILISVSENIKWLSYFFQIITFIVSPFYCLNMGFSMLIFEDFSDLMFKYSIIYQYYYFCFINLGQFVLFALITYWLESRRFSLKSIKKNVFQNTNSNNSTEFQFEEDIIKEKQLVWGKDNQIKARDLEKYYENGFHALKGIDFGVERGMIFGLLGPNGAGKSTTFNIMTALIPKSSGSVKLKDIEVNKGKMEIFKDVAICPQFDCLWDNLNPIEHLYLFGRMKGLSGENLKKAVNYFMKTMQLESYEKTIASKLSGGNKRKLCVANALIGGPDLQFFDEPSSGVDAIAKRCLWNTLKQSLERRNASIVLTTHSMNEADSLCNKIGF